MRENNKESNDKRINYATHHAIILNFKKYKTRYYQVTDKTLTFENLIFSVLYMAYLFYKVICFCLFT